MLDLRELTFVDSSGLHALVGAYNRSELNGHRILLVGASRSLRRLCEMTGTEFLFDPKGTAHLLDRFTAVGSRDGNREGGAVAHPHT